MDSIVSAEVTADEDGREVCAICLDSLSDLPVARFIMPHRVGACNHYCHYNCAQQLRKKNCPICRAAFSRIQGPLSKESILLSPYHEVYDNLSVFAGGKVQCNNMLSFILALFPFASNKYESHFYKLVLKNKGLMIPEKFSLSTAQHHSMEITFNDFVIVFEDLNNSNASPTNKSFRYEQKCLWQRRMRHISLKLCGCAGGIVNGLVIGGGVASIAGLFISTPPPQYLHNVKDKKNEPLKIRRRNKVTWEWDDLFYESSSPQVKILIIAGMIIWYLRSILWWMIFQALSNKKHSITKVSKNVFRASVFLGASIGAFMGWKSALEWVDPFNHNHKAIFIQACFGAFAAGAGEVLRKSRYTLRNCISFLFP